MPKAIHQRHQQLLALLDERGELAVETLARELHTSEATVRRDLIALEGQGLLVRTFGGARSIRESSLAARTFGEKRQQMCREKEAIARVAVQFVHPGMTVALDSGTTVWRIATMLREKAPLTIVTSALAPVEELGSIPGISLYLVGGKFRPENLDFFGPRAVAGYDQFRADLAFVGADSVQPDRGTFSLEEEGASVAAAVAGCARRKVVVVDHSKFAGTGNHLILPSAAIDVLVTDQGLDEKDREALAGAPFELVFANGDR
jgi:DeoR family fructose operon transcriptional repressor